MPLIPKNLCHNNIGLEYGEKYCFLGLGQGKKNFYLFLHIYVRFHALYVYIGVLHCEVSRYRNYTNKYGLLKTRTVLEINIPLNICKVITHSEECTVSSYVRVSYN